MVTWSSRILTGALVLTAAYVEAEWPLAIEAQHRPGTIWWCPGSTWDQASIDHNLEALAGGGIGTVHVVPIYGAKGYEDRVLPYLSPAWLTMFGAILEKADALGLQVDMTTGTGWCFGGATVAGEDGDQVASWKPDEGLRIRTGMKVKRASPGAGGPMLDPYSVDAMRRYLAPFETALADLRPRAQYHDSFEYRGNWTPALLERFKARYGYDLEAFLPALFGEPSAEAARIKHDYREMLAEMHREVIAHWADWSRARGMITRNQAHGAPANLLDVYAAADVPETEMFGSPDFPIPGFRHEEAWTRKGDSDPRICMMASSAAHVTKAPGKQLASSESCTWMREHWHGTLGQIKLEMDLFFLAGINHVFYHGSCYSPVDAPWPGFYFYASTKADPRNAFWRDMPALNRYIARCQSVLQAGGHDNDVLVYWPIHDLWMSPEGLDRKLTVHSHGWMDGSRLGTVSNRLSERGYAYDYLSDRMLDQLSCEGGRIVAPGGAYAALVVPAAQYLPVATATRLAALAEAGAVVIVEEGDAPPDVPGYAALGQRRAQLAEVVQRLRHAGARFVAEAEDGLSEAGIRREALADSGLRFVRRRVDQSTWYFVANHTASDSARWIALSAPGAVVYGHDPMTGGSKRLRARNRGGSREVFLSLAAGESGILEVNDLDRAGVVEDVPLAPSGPLVELAGEWAVSFLEGGPALPQDFTTSRLGSWAEQEDAEGFAGTARYTLDFVNPGNAPDWLLDLGDVRESARVRVNGREVATLVALPFRTRIGHALRPGANRLEIEVTNTSANRIRALDRSGTAWRIMQDINIVNTDYKSFEPADWPVKPAGLLGSVTLTPLAPRLASAVDASR